MVIAATEREGVKNMEDENGITICVEYDPDALLEAVGEAIEEQGYTVTDSHYHGDREILVFALTEDEDEGDRDAEAELTMDVVLTFGKARTRAKVKTTAADPA